MIIMLKEQNSNNSVTKNMLNSKSCIEERKKLYIYTKKKKINK